MTTPNLRLQVEDFGPIREADVELKPLTLFIGPNNTGKTYLAKLAYALLSAVTYGQPLAWRGYWSDEDDEDEPRAWREWSALSDHQRATVRAALDRRLIESKRRIEDAFTRYFGPSAAGRLVGSGRHRQTSVSSVVTAPPEPRSLGIRLSLSKQDGFEVSLIPPAREFLEAPDDLDALTIRRGAPGIPQARLEWWLWQRLLERSGYPSANSLYLPSGRSGLIAASQAVAAAAFSVVGRTTARGPDEIGALSGVEGDFVRIMVGDLPADEHLLMGRGWTWDLALALQLLEAPLMNGLILVRSSPAGVPVIVFEQDGRTYPMGQSSSMVAELAPLALWLKAFLRAGDVLIIDEPEAHLHPENQRLIARVLVRLANAGVRIVATTHSSLILRQISNCMIASTISDQDRSVLGLHRTDTIGFDQVAAYVFEPGPTGSVVGPIEVDPEFGFSEDEFVRVSEAIGDESSHLLDALRRPVFA